MPTRLRRIDLTALVERSGVDPSQVPSVGATIAFYREGAYVSASATVLSTDTNKVVSVYNAGRLRVGDTVQKGTSAAATATVAAITSPTSIKLNGASGTLTLAQGDRLVVTNSRPTIYREPSGVLVATSSPSPVTDAGGSGDWHSTEPVVDAIVSGGTPAISASGRYGVPAGYFEPRPWLDLRDYGLDETGLRLAIDALPSGGGTVYIPSGAELTLSSALTITKPGVRLLGDTGARSRIIASAVDPTHHLVIVEALAVVLENLELDGRATSAASYDVLRIAYNAQIINRTIVQNCALINARRYGLFISGAYDTMIRDNSITGCYSSAYRTENGAAVTTHTYFENCAFNANDVGAADVPAVSMDSASGQRFKNCRFEANRGLTTNAIFGVACEGVHVETCHFEVITTGPYVPPSRPLTYVQLVNTRTPVFLNNSFFGGLDSGLRPSYAILLDTSEYATIIGGKMNAIDSYGVYGNSGSPFTLINVEVSGFATTHVAPDGSTVVSNTLKPPCYPTASLPTKAAANEGELAFDLTTHQLKYVNSSGTWAAV